MAGISTHVLDLAAGRPAAGVAVVLERRDGDGWRRVGASATDTDGRARDLLPAGEPLAAGEWRLVFATGAWAAAASRPTFYPEVAIAFTVADPAQHHHVPLLLAPHGYSTYRGS